MIHEKFAPAAAALQTALGPSATAKAGSCDVDEFIRHLCEVRRRTDEVIALATAVWDSGILTEHRHQLSVLRYHLLQRVLLRCCTATQRGALQLWRRRCLLQRSLEEALAHNKLAGSRQLRQWCAPSTPRTVYQGPMHVRRPLPRNAPVPTSTSWEERALATPRADLEEAKACERLRRELAEAQAASEVDRTAEESEARSEALARQREASMLQECAQLRQSLRTARETVSRGQTPRQLG